MNRNAALLERLAQASPDMQRRILTEDLLELVVVFLGFDPNERIYPDENFLELGFDSLKAVDFKILLEANLDCSLSATVLFDCATPEALVTYLLNVLTGPRHVNETASLNRKSQHADLPGNLDDLPAKELSRLLRLKHARLQSIESANTEPIAIVAMACRFPGGSRDTSTYWDLLESGRDGIEEVPATRWDVHSLFDEDPNQPGRMYTRWGGFLENIDQFDAGFFSIPPLQACALDPAQRLLLEVTWEALESGSIPPDTLAGSSTGVFIGTRGADYFQGHSDWRPEDATRYYATGNATSTLAGRISYSLNLTGPAFALDTACSSSLVALHQAVLSLRRGECSAAIVGAANVLLDPFGTIAICKAQMLSADGRCKTFDASADGYVRSEGCGVIVLKRLSRAEADGNRILALVRGSAVNQDGASGGLTVPSSSAQESVIRQALASAHLDPDSIDYIEAHGTGTSLGDPIEVTALDAVFGTQTRRGKLPVGTVKTQIGHLEPAAGIAGLIRVVLAMGHEKLTPNLHFHQPNPHIPWNRTVISVVDKPHLWPRVKERPRRAGINSFGFSGTNAHVVLEEAPLRSQDSSQGARPMRPALLVISAKSPLALVELAKRYAQLLSTSKEPFAQIAEAAATGRNQHRFRHCVLANNNAEAQAKLDTLTSDDLGERIPAATPRIAFLFTGQGSQYPRMGAELHAQSPAFRKAFDAAAAAVRAVSSLDLHAEIFGGGQALNETRVTQPALFAIQYGLTHLWSSFGIQPTYVLGHSVGEYAAACAAGVLGLEDAARLIVARSALMTELTKPGAMLSVLAGPDLVDSLCKGISPDLSIAAHNCDARVSVSGPPEAVERLEARLKECGERYERLEVNRAFHSAMMDPMLEAFGSVAKQVNFQAPQISFVSTLDTCCHFGPNTPLETPAYWVKHLREPVRFRDAMRTLELEGFDILLEVGPSPHLLGLARRFLSNAKTKFLPSMRPGRGEWSALLTSLGVFFEAGSKLTWNSHASGEVATQVELPSYPFQRQRFWLEPRKGDKSSEQNPGQETLLGTRLDLARLSPTEALFSSQLAIQQADTLRDHRVAGQAIFPAAGFLSLMVEAAVETGRATKSHVLVQDLNISAALPLDDAGVRIETHIESGPPSSQSATISIHASSLNLVQNASTWRPHADACLPCQTPDDPPGSIRLKPGHNAQHVPKEEHYKRLFDLGLEYGPAYQTVSDAWVCETECIAHIHPTDSPSDGHTLVSAATLDGCFQCATFVIPEELANTPLLPLGVDSFELWRPLQGTLVCRAKLAEHKARSLAIDLTIANEKGDMVAAVKGLRLLATDRATLLAIGNPLERLAFIREWPTSPLIKHPDTPPQSERRLWILTPEDGVNAALATQLASGLESQGAHAQLLTPEQILSALASEFPTDIVDLNWLIDSPKPADLGQPAKAATSTRSLLNTIHNLGAARPRLWLLTKGATLDATDLIGATALGIARTIELERPTLKVTVLDLDPLRDELDELIQELLMGSPEREVAWRDGQRHVARLAAGARPKTGRLVVPKSKTWRLGTRRFGSLDQLGLLPTEAQTPGPDEVQIKVEAAALNFKDVLFALGMLKEHTGITRALEQPLGHECAGRISALGTRVKQQGRLAIGQPVFCSTPRAMQNSVTVSASAVMPNPSCLSMSEAAGLPTVFLTVLYGLGRVARIKRGDRILIHAAAGGVGQAAIQVARRSGAEIFATASRGKWSYLRSQGIHHIFDSRTFDYSQEILQATGGVGVDVVLDSMADEHVACSLAALAQGGRFIELGKLGVWSPERMYSERPDVDYALFDMADVLSNDQALQVELLEELVQGFEVGDFTPPPTRSFPMHRAEAAFRHLAGARNIGKIALEFPVPSTSTEQKSITRNDAAYVVTGGLGALGMHVARWLGKHGAGEVLLLGRSAPDEQAVRSLAGLGNTHQGTTFRTTSVDVTDADQLRHALQSLKLPLRGVLHAAGQLDDGLIDDLTWKRFESVIAPKWTGAWNLHAETLDHELDFFILFSSMTAMLGAAGQANYAAANAGLDALATWRRSQGLPALSIAWGPWSGGGMATRAAATSALELAGIGSLSPQVAITTLEHLLSLDDANAVVGVLAVDWARYLSRRSPLPTFEQLLPRNAASADPSALVRTINLAATPQERKSQIKDLITTELASVLGFNSPNDVDTSLPFAQLGVDSLLAVDLRNRLEAAVEFELPVTLLFDHENLDSLVAYLGATLDSPKHLRSTEDDEEEAIKEHIASLTDEEVERMLAEEQRATGELDG